MECILLKRKEKNVNNVTRPDFIKWPFPSPKTSKYIPVKIRFSITFLEQPSCEDIWIRNKRIHHIPFFKWWQKLKEFFRSLDFQFKTRFSFFIQNEKRNFLSIKELMINFFFCCFCSFFSCCVWMQVYSKESDWGAFWLTILYKLVGC